MSDDTTPATTSDTASEPERLPRAYAEWAAKPLRDRNAMFMFLPEEIHVDVERSIATALRM